MVLPLQLNDKFLSLWGFLYFGRPLNLVVYICLYYYILFSDFFDYKLS